MHPSSILFVISAPSGAGKTSLITRLIQEDPNLCRVITHTTRLPRPSEKHEVDYHFVSSEKFNYLKQKGDLVEHAKVFGLDYGTTAKSIESACFDPQKKQPRDAIINIDYQGAKCFINTYPKQATSIFILPPSWEALEARLRSRGSDSEVVIRQRLQAAREEIAQYGLFNYCVVNDNFEITLKEIQAIIIAERAKTERVYQKPSNQKLFSDFLETN